MYELGARSRVKRDSRGFTIKAQVDAHIQLAMGTKRMFERKSVYETGK